jgi:DNA invertase Pin-like site-specific DNA recombinase
VCKKRSFLTIFSKRSKNLNFSTKKPFLFLYCHVFINVCKPCFFDEFTLYSFQHKYNEEGKRGKIMKIGYIRVSRDKQTTLLQEDAMEQEKCDRTFTDKMSGKRFDRPEFLRMLDIARPGDVIVVWRLDRLGRSLKHLVETVTLLEERKIELRSLNEHIDTTTPTGKLMFHFMAALAEFERGIIRERTMAGLEAARARGKRGGRPKATDTIKPENLKRARELYLAEENTIAEIMALTGFKSSHTFYKYIVNPLKTERN